ncbi:GNAT family N-acetyltransferase [Streptomyces sp. NPDC057638]|uniref:GNAT family N-acetyltransferase n=1 Tax=Streptomyces sp. NPDC057638 TaxID=3346190 RepID=UPI00369A2084
MDDLMTPRLTLRPLTVADVMALIARAPAPGSRWAPGYPLDGDITAARRLLDHPGEHPGVYEIRHRADGSAIGGVGFHGPADPCGALTVGYGLIPSARGRGYAAEALRAVLASARERGFTRVRGDADHDNPASHRVMVSAGMRRVSADERVAYYETSWHRPS